TDPDTFIGGVALRVAPQSRFEDGLDLIAPRSVRPGDVPRRVGSLATGPGQLDDPPIPALHDENRIAIRSHRPMPVHVAGEDLGDVTEAVFEAERAAVRVLV